MVPGHVGMRTAQASRFELRALATWRTTDSFRGIPGGIVHAIAEDMLGNLWIANQNLGLFRLSAERVVEKIPWDRLGRKDFARSLGSDPLQGGLWIGFGEGDVAYFVDGPVRASFTVVDGLGQGSVNDFRFDEDGTLWAATESGLSRLKDGHIATLASKDGLPCDAVHWVMEDDARSFWLGMPCGLIRLARSELDVWVAAAQRKNDANQIIQTTVFDNSDGVRNQSRAGGYSPQVGKSSDGKLWFSSFDGVSVVDPHHLPFNSVLPPVHIEQITVDHKTYDVASAPREEMRLPSLVRDVEIDYTALSLAAPEKIRFRYRLEGWDREWQQDVGNRRQAFYNNLPPRNYRFRVIASNNSGVWNETGTSLDFSIDPADYQTTWFRAVAVSAVLAVLWGLYQLRLRQLAYAFDLRLQSASTSGRASLGISTTRCCKVFTGCCSNCGGRSGRLPLYPLLPHRFSLTLDTPLACLATVLSKARAPAESLPLLACDTGYTLRDRVAVTAGGPRDGSIGLLHDHPSSGR